MGSTEWLGVLMPVVNIVQVLAGLGLTTIALAFLNRYVERRRWRAFKTSVSEWIGQLKDLGSVRGSDLSEEQWQAECERMLSNSRFGPREITQILDMSVIVAKSVATDMFF